MDILYLLIPLSVVLVLFILGVFAWAVHGGQFDDLEQHGEQILEAATDSVDMHQGAQGDETEESSGRHGPANNNRGFRWQDKRRPQRR